MHSSSEPAATYLHVNFCTYTDLTRAGSAVIPFVEMAVDLAQRAGIRLRVSVERPGARRSRTGRALTPKAWAETRAALESGEYVNLLLFNDGASTEFGLTVRAEDVYASLLARLRDARARERIAQAQARPSPRFVNFALRPMPTDVQPIVEITCDAFRELHAACGFIGPDPLQFISGDQTQHELSLRRHWSQAPGMFQTKLRGAYWGNLLSARHVDLLGGIERVQREAPCQRVEARGDSVYLQVSEHPARVDTHQLQSLSSYLEPLLR